MQEAPSAWSGQGRRRAALTGVALCLSGCLFYDSRWGDAKVAQQNAAQHYSAPKVGQVKQPLDRLPERRPELRRMRIIAFATQEHAAQVVNWQARFRETVEQANQVLRPELAIELDVVEGGLWRPEDASDRLEALLDDLTRSQAEAEADWVVGLVGALSRLEPSFHELGVARLLGKHLVLRAANDALEYDVIEREFTELGPAERAALYRSRRAHQAGTVLIHELAHSLGAIHVQTPTEMMYSQYNTTMTTLGGGVARLVRITLGERTLPKPEQNPQGMAKSLQTELGLNHAPWVPQEKIEFLAYLATLAQTPGSAQAMPSSVRALTTPGTDGPALSDTEQSLFNTALQHKAAGRFAQAWTEGQPLFQSHPENHAVAELRCQLAMDQQLPWLQTRAECEPLMKLGGFNK